MRKIFLNNDQSVFMVFSNVNYLKLKVKDCRIFIDKPPSTENELVLSISGK